MKRNVQSYRQGLFSAFFMPETCQNPGTQPTGFRTRLPHRHLNVTFATDALQTLGTISTLGPAPTTTSSPLAQISSWSNNLNTTVSRARRLDHTRVEGPAQASAEFRDPNSAHCPRPRTNNELPNPTSALCGRIARRNGVAILTLKCNNSTLASGNRLVRALTRSLKTGCGGPVLPPPGQAIQG